MTKRILAALALAAALCAPAFADHGDKGNKHHGNKHYDDAQSWDHRDGYDYRVFPGGDKVPPGWSRGKKTGWKNCGMPPGQAKKYGCRTYVYEGRPYYYYRDDVGQIVVRRPTIEVHGSIDITH